MRVVPVVRRAVSVWLLVMEVAALVLVLTEFVNVLPASMVVEAIATDRVELVEIRRVAVIVAAVLVRSVNEIVP